MYTYAYPYPYSYLFLDSHSYFSLRPIYHIPFPILILIPISILSLFSILTGKRFAMRFLHSVPILLSNASCIRNNPLRIFINITVLISFTMSAQSSSCYYGFVIHIENLIYVFVFPCSYAHSCLTFINIPTSFLRQSGFLCHSNQYLNPPSLHYLISIPLSLPCSLTLYLFLCHFNSLYKCLSYCSLRIRLFLFQTHPYLHLYVYSYIPCYPHPIPKSMLCLSIFLF